MRHIRPEQATLIRELCQDLAGARPADYILSYIHLADERRETPKMMSERLRLESAARGVEVVYEPAYCAHCGKTFTRTILGQQYCPDPVEVGVVSCGRQAMLFELHKRRPGRRTADPNAPAPPVRDLSPYVRAARNPLG